MKHAVWEGHNIVCSARKSRRKMEDKNQIGSYIQALFHYKNPLSKHTVGREKAECDD